MEPDNDGGDQVEAPLAYRVVRGGAWIAAGSYFAVGFGFLANLALTRILAPEHFGSFVLAEFFFALINLRPKVGIGHAFAQRQETTGALVGTHLAIDILSGLGNVLLAAIAFPILRAFGYSLDVLWIVLALSGISVIDSLMGTPYVLLEKDLQFEKSALISTATFPLSYIPAFLLALNGWGYWSLVAQVGVYALLQLVGMWWAARRWVRVIHHIRWSVDRSVALNLLRFGVTVGLGTLAASLVGQYDNFLVGTYVGLATLGFYDRAYRIAQWPAILEIHVVNRAAFYTYARLQDDPVRLRKAVTMTLWLITIVGLPLALAVFFAAPDLVRFLYGEEWLQSAVYLRFLVFYSLSRPLLDIARSLFVAVGEPRQATVVALAQIGSLALVATPLTAWYGVAGTAVGVAVAFAIGVLVAYRYTQRIVTIQLSETFAAPLIAAAAAAGSYLLLVQRVDLAVLPLPVRLVIKGSFVVVAFYATLLAIQPRPFLDRSSYVWRLLRGRPPRL